MPSSAVRIVPSDGAKIWHVQEEFTRAMQGIVCDTDARVRDEAPQAYKDLAKVMANQASLTEVVHRYLCARL